MALSQRPYGVSPGPPTGLLAQTLNVPAVQGNVFPSSLVNPVAEAIFANPALGAPTALIAALPNDTNLEQIPLKLYASGVCTVNALTTTVTIGLYGGSSLTLASDIALKNSGAITPLHLKFPWFLDGSFIYDSQSGLLQGSAAFQLDGQLVAAAAWTLPITNVNNDNSPVATFVLSGKVGASNPQNLLTVSAFSLG